MEDRRKYQRVSLVVKVTNNSTKEFHYFYSRDISQGGMFLETRQPYDVGADVNLDFFLPLREKKERIIASGSVARVVDYDPKGKEDQLAGMGVEFDGLPSEIIGAIAKFVRETEDEDSD